MRAAISGAALLGAGLVLGVLIGVHLPDRVGGPDATPARVAAARTPVGTPVATPAASGWPLTVALGDSITYNAGSWIRQLCAGRALLPNCLNRGIRGNTTAQMLDRLTVDVLAHRPAVVIVMGGTNDLARRDPRTVDILNRLDLIVRQSRTAGAAVVLCTIPPRDDFAPAVLVLNQAIRAYAARTGVPLLDLYPAVGDQAGRFRAGLSPDGVHPSERGAALMTALARAKLPALLPPAAVVQRNP